MQASAEVLDAMLAVSLSTMPPSPPPPGIEVQGKLLVTPEILRGPFPGGRFKRTVPPLDIAEAQHVSRAVRRALKGTRATCTDDASARDWVSYRYEGLLLRLLFQSYSNARNHLIVNAVVIAGGFATSGLAVTATRAGKHATASPTVAWCVFGIGLAVALAGGVSQLYRPGHRATGRAELAARLRDEGWSLSDGHGEYGKAANAGDRFAIFDRRVAEIRDGAAQLARLSDEQQTRRGRRPKP